MFEIFQCHIKTLGCFHNIDLLEHQKAFETLKILRSNTSADAYIYIIQSINSWFKWLLALCLTHWASTVQISHLTQSPHDPAGHQLQHLILVKSIQQKLFLNHWDNELTLLQINDWQTKSLHWEALLSIKLYWTVAYCTNFIFCGKQWWKGVMTHIIQDIQSGDLMSFIHSVPKISQ